MNKRDFVLAAFAGVNQRPLTPVQAQKLVFLADRNVGPSIGGSGFTFLPYNYGPFDSDVYRVLEDLSTEGLAEIDAGSPRTYRLTPQGQEVGEQIARQGLAPQYVQYLTEAAEFVYSQSFSGLISSIYKAYPEMKANSVFRE